MGRDQPKAAPASCPSPCCSPEDVSFGKLDSRTMHACPYDHGSTSPQGTDAALILINIAAVCSRHPHKRVAPVQGKCLFSRKFPGKRLNPRYSIWSSPNTGSRSWPSTGSIENDG